MLDFLFDEQVEAIAVSLEDSWSEAYSSKLHASLVPDEDFRCGKR